MPDWKKKFYPAGTRVEVMLVADKTEAQGTLLTDWKSHEGHDDDRKLTIEQWLAELDDQELFGQMPRIQLDNGCIVTGIDCFWAPLEELEKS